MTPKHRLALTLIAILLPLLNADANERVVQIRPDLAQIEVWNRFVQGLHALHQKQISTREIDVHEEELRYGGEAAREYFYHEQRFRERGSQRELSRIRRDKDHPERLHLIEVNVYDNGRVVRDYGAIFLPWAQAAPIRTFINLHAYRNGLHAFRQFDASGDLIYEQCQGEWQGQRVWVDITEPKVNPNRPASEIDRACFAALPRQAGAYLTPH
jgi:hypothetical protein